MNSVVHFEIPFDDKKRDRAFYEKVFGWQLQDIEEMDYVIARTGETDPKTFMLKKIGIINGGMYKRDEKSSPTPVLVIDVPDINSKLKEIQENGGEITKEKSTIGDMGYYAQAKDTEGNIIGIWETIKK